MHWKTASVTRKKSVKGENSKYEEVGSTVCFSRVVRRAGVATCIQRRAGGEGKEP